MKSTAESDAHHHKEEGETPETLWSDRRAVTPPLPGEEEASEARITHSQSQCGLFDLPAEIREMIWLHVMSPSGLIHIKTRGDRVCGHEYKPECKLPDRPERFQVQPSQSDAGETREGYRFIGLLSTCRRVYSEAIDMLYKRNTFYICDLLTLHLLAQAVVPAKLSLIKSVTLFSYVCGHRERPSCKRLRPWRGTSIALQKMTGLQRLHVSFMQPWGAQNIENTRPFLLILKEIRVPDFVVEMYDDLKCPGTPWNDRFPGDFEGDQPFRMVILPPDGK